MNIQLQGKSSLQFALQQQGALIFCSTCAASRYVMHASVFCSLINKYVERAMINVLHVQTCTVTGE